MRKQDKYTIRGALIVGALTTVVDVWLQAKEQRNAGHLFTWEAFDGFRTFKRATLGAFVGGIVAKEIYKEEFRQECSIAFSSDRFIKDALKAENIKSNQGKYEAVKKMKHEIKTTLFQTFSEELVCFPEDIGSLAKATAIESTYDGDIVLAFKKRNSFATLSNMSQTLHNKIESLYAEKAIVTKNKKTTNIRFKDLSDSISVDVVYGRESGNYNRDKKLNLYVRPDFFWQSGTHFKTDISIQKFLLTNRPKVREVIRAFKLYFKKNGIGIENSLLEQLVLEAMSTKNYGTDSSVTENLLNCMEYISQKINNAVIRDYANSNNNLLDKMDIYSIRSATNLLNSDLRKIELNRHYIIEAFHN